MPEREPKSMNEPTDTKKQLQPSHDIPKPPQEPLLSNEEIERRKSGDGQTIKEIRAALGIDGQEIADEQTYEQAENFDTGVALLRDRIRAHIAEKKNVLVALSGKTGSGKTTLANELRRIMGEDKIDITIVGTDDFYLPDSDELDLERLHATINKLQQGEPVGNLTPAKVILIEGLQTIEDRTVGRKPDVRTYITAPADKRLSARLLRDEQVGFRSIKESLRKLAELTPETVSAIQKFEADPSMEGVDIVVNNDRENPSEPKLYISGDTLVFSVPGGVTETIKIAPDKVPFLEQIGIRRQ